ncbi:MAG: SDR family oxidoreductase, partial [Ilumatobacteraceae bacterium]|nr:SDR family oxidoreductase [Ilumatobacteraceae bacterium]
MPDSPTGSPATPIATWSAPPTTVITGAAGWLGRALVHRLLTDPQRVHLRLLAHSTAEADALRQFATDEGGFEGRRIDIIIGDVARADTAARLMHHVGG